MLCCDCERTLCFQTGRARLDLQCSVGYGIVSVAKWCRYSSRILWKILFQDMLSKHQKQKIYFDE